MTHETAHVTTQETESTTTLADIHRLWREIAVAKDLSPVSLRNTENTFKRICRFIPGDTLLSELDENRYYKLLADCRSHGYSEETIRDVNTTLRKFLNLAERKKLVCDSMLRHCDRVKIGRRKEYRVVEPEEMQLLDDTLQTCFKERHRQLINLLYYTGVRIGEALALTYADIIELSCRTDEGCCSTHVVSVTKSYDSALKLVKSTKNYKLRHIPLTDTMYDLLAPAIEAHKKAGGSPDERIFPYSQSFVSQLLHSAYTLSGISPLRCHDFRHTFISNLVKAGLPLPVIEKVSGDTQATILSRYSHCFKDDELLVLDVMSKL